MRGVLLTWGLFSATGAEAGERAAPALMHGEAAEPSVSVCIDRDVGPADMQLARMFAFRIFARIGTKIEWRCSGGSEPSIDRKSTRLNSSHLVISYAVFCLKKT